MSGPGPGASSPSPGPFTPGHHGGRLPPSRGARSFLPLRLLGDTGRRIRSEFDAKDEEYVPKLGHYLCQDHVAQYASELTRNVDQFFLCRRKGCLTVARNIDWINTEPDGARYACPECLAKYAPWTSKSNYVQANRVFW